MLAFMSIPCLRLHPPCTAGQESDEVLAQALDDLLEDPDFLDAVADQVSRDLGAGLRVLGLGATLTVLGFGVWQPEFIHALADQVGKGHWLLCGALFSYRQLSIVSTSSCSSMLHARRGCVLSVSSL